MFSYDPPGTPITKGNNISLVYNTKSKEEMHLIFIRLKDDGGKVIEELQESASGDRYGSLTDKFGIIWQFC